MNALLQVASIPPKVRKHAAAYQETSSRPPDSPVIFDIAVPTIVFSYFSGWTKTCYAVRTTLPYLALIQMSGPQARTRWDMPCRKAIPTHQSTPASGPRALDDYKDVLYVLHTPFRFPRRKLRRKYKRGIIYLDQRAAGPIFWHQFSRWFRAQL